MIHCKNRDTLGVFRLVYTSVHYISLLCFTNNNPDFPLFTSDLFSAAEGEKKTPVCPPNQRVKANACVSHDFINRGVVVIPVYPNSQGAGATFGNSRAG